MPTEIYVNQDLMVRSTISLFERFTREVLSLIQVEILLDSVSRLQSSTRQAFRHKANVAYRWIEKFRKSCEISENSCLNSLNSINCAAEKQRR